MRQSLLIVVFLCSFCSPLFAMHPIEEAMQDEMNAKYARYLKEECKKQGDAQATKKFVIHEKRIAKKQNKWTKKSVHREIKNLIKSNKKMLRRARKTIRKKSRDVKKYLKKQKRKDRNTLKLAKKSDDIRPLSRRLREKYSLYPEVVDYVTDDPDIFVDYHANGQLSMVMSFRQGKLIGYEEYDNDGVLSSRK